MRESNLQANEVPALPTGQKARVGRGRAKRRAVDVTWRDVRSVGRGAGTGELGELRFFRLFPFGVYLQIADSHCLPLTLAL